MAERWRSLGLVAAFVGLLALIVTAGLYLLLGQFTLLVQGLLTLGVLLLAGSLWAYADAVEHFLRSRGFRYGSNTVVAIIAFIGIIALLDFLSLSYFKRWDLTAGGQLSLSTQTLRILDSLTEDVRVLAFFREENESRRKAKNLIEEYSNHSQRVKVELYDPDYNPVLVNTYNVFRDGTVVFERGEKRQPVTRIGETDYTNALVRVSREGQRKAYFLTGHNERDTENQQDLRGYLIVAKELESDNYAVELLNLVISPTVPMDASVLIVADPQRDLLLNEQEAISNYLDRGGKAVFLVEPTSTSSLRPIAHRWGVELGGGIVVDPVKNFFNSIGVPVIDTYLPTPLTTDIVRDLESTFFPIATAVLSTQTTPPKVDLDNLFATSPQSWLETDPQAAQYDPALEVRGSVNIAVALEAEPEESPPADSDQVVPKTRIVFFGDADFASNQAVLFLGNRDLFMNAVNWAAQANELLGIRPKPSEFRSLVMTPEQVRFAFVTSFIFLPLVVLLFGAGVWWARR